MTIETFSVMNETQFLTQKFNCLSINILQTLAN